MGKGSSLALLLLTTGWMLGIWTVYLVLRVMDRSRTRFRYKSKADSEG